MESTIEYRKQQINDFFLLTPPKHLSPELIVKIVVSIILVIVPALLFSAKLSTGICIYICFLVIVYISWLRPRLIKSKKYRNRISSSTLNNWLLKTLKTKIPNRVIEYLELGKSYIADEQFIIIPYPVFHFTKKINNQSIIRVKSTKTKKIERDSKEFYYNYTVWNIQVLVLGINYLSYYFCSYNWLKDEVLNEKTNEYFYRDIALVKSEFEQVLFYTKWDKNPITEAHVVKIVHNSGDVLNLITELPELQQPSETIINIKNIEKVIRLLIRQAKIKAESCNNNNVDFSTKVVEK
jgi:hypothetical protein